MKDFNTYPISSMELINWRHSDEHCSLPTIRLFLNESVQKDSLQKALDQTLKRYRILHLTTKEEDGQLVYTEAENIHPVENLSYETPVTLGLHEGYSPWVIRYYDNSIAFHFHHGLMDGRSACEVLKTLLYYYALQLGKDVDSTGIRTLNDPASLIEEESKDPVVLCYQDGLTPLKEKEPLQASCFKKDTLSSSHYCRLFVDKNAFMKKVKELETSPFALTSVLLARSLKQYYEEEYPIINIGIVADYRTIFSIESMHNFISMGKISYECEKMDHKSLELACTMFRSVMDVMLQKENANRHLADSRQLDMLLRPAPLSERGKQVLQYILSVQSSTSFIISYIGRFLLPDGLREMVNDMSVYVPGRSANLVEMIDLNDQFILNISHCFNNTDFITSLEEQLKALNIPSHLENDSNTVIVRP